MYIGNILDPIHGLIKLSEIEKWVLSQKPFNRLRRVKQNTFLYLVFPSANHTRFEHSIGVMHLADKIYENANENFKTGESKRGKYKDPSDKKECFFSVKGSLGDFETVAKQELRLAALMHDIGHGPMSHKFDEFAISKEALLEIIELDLPDYQNNFKALIENNGNKIDHEIISCVFILKLLENLKSEVKKQNTNFSEKQQGIIKKINPVRIVNMIEPKFNIEISNKYGEVDYINFFSSIISSFPLDADRMDYLYRDSYFAGVKYGLYDLSRILMSFIPVKEGNNISLAIKESGIDSVIRFIQSRTHLYKQVYYHKTNRAANCMLDYCCKDIDKTDPIINAENYDELEDFYWVNSDEIFLMNLLKKRTDINKDVLDELLSRKLWKRVYEEKIIITNNVKNVSNLEQLNSEIKTISKELAKKGIDVWVDKYNDKVFKDIDKSKLKIAKKTNGKYSIVDDWQDFNEEMSILKCDIFMFRIYLRRKFKTPEEYLEQKQEILNSFEDVISSLKNVYSLKSEDVE